LARCQAPSTDSRENLAWNEGKKVLV